MTGSRSDPSYDKAIQLIDQLIQEYIDASLDDVIEGKKIENEVGSCYKIHEEYPNIFPKFNENYCVKQILSSLTLVCGIGPYYENQLRAEGYSSIPELLKHPKWGFPAKEFLEVYEKKDIHNLHKWMWRFFPKTHPLVYLSSGIFKPQDFTVFDIETMGLYEAPIILLGIGRQVKNKVQTTQYLLTDISDEPTALLETFKEIQKSKALITFNGRTFDIPYLKDRLAFYGLDIIQEPPHFDLLHYTRLFIGNQLPTCTLNNVENHLGIKRENDIPNSIVPQFYERYLETKNPGPLIPIIEHNKQDLITLVSLFNRFHEELT